MKLLAVEPQQCGRIGQMYALWASQLSAALGEECEVVFVRNFGDIAAIRKDEVIDGVVVRLLRDQRPDEAVALVRELVQSGYPAGRIIGISSHMGHRTILAQAGCTTFVRLVGATNPLLSQAATLRPPVTMPA